MYSVNWLGLVLGAIAGSVANSLIYRLPRSLDWVRERSHCPKCKHTLAGRDLTPLLSYLYLRGRCRYCHKNIGWRYFAVEIVLAIVGATQSWPILGLAFVSTVVAIMDWQTQLVSEWMIIVGVFFALFLPISLPAAALGAGIIGLFWALSRGRAMGFGDVEIAAWLGLWLGVSKTAVFLWVAFVLGGLIGLIGLISHISRIKDKIAFGPFLIAGAWIAYFWSDTILRWIGFRL